MQATDRPIANPDAVLREEFDDWALLFEPVTGEAVGIGPVGVAIWKLLDGQRTLAQIAAEIEAMCEDAPDTVLEDAVAFVSDLERHLLVKIAADREG